MEMSSADRKHDFLSALNFAGSISYIQKGKTDCCDSCSERRSEKRKKDRGSKFSCTDELPTHS
jgi:hypothetical protein